MPIWHGCLPLTRDAPKSVIFHVGWPTIMGFLKEREKSLYNIIYQQIQPTHHFTNGDINGGGEEEKEGGEGEKRGI